MILVGIHCLNFEFSQERREMQERIQKIPTLKILHESITVFNISIRQIITYLSMPNVRDGTNSLNTTLF